MNLLIVTSPRTAGSYFSNEYLPNEYLGPSRKDYYKGSISKHVSDDRTFYNHCEMLDNSKQSMQEMLYIESDETPRIKRVDPYKYLSNCYEYWQELYTYSKDVHALKIFRNHFHEQGKMQTAMNIKRLVDCSDVMYVVYRKDMTAVVYSLYYAWTTKMYGNREINHNESLDIDVAIWKRLEQSIISNYDFMLAFAKKHDVEILCTEDDLPHKPFNKYHTYNNNSLVCEAGDFFHQQFQNLKL